MTGRYVRVALDHPLDALYDYRYTLDTCEPEPGRLVRVPFGRRDVVGLICEVNAHSDVPADKIRNVIEICAACHPLFTGQQKLVDTAGRVDKFNQRSAAAKRKQEEAAARKAAREAKKAAAAL